MAVTTRSAKPVTLRALAAITAATVSSTFVVGLVAPSAMANTPRQAASASLGNLTTYGYGNARTDDDPTESRIVSLSASASWDDKLDGAVYGQPLLDDGRLYVATEADSVYALAARSGKVQWHVHLGTAPSLATIDSAPTLRSGCGDIDPLGITGTPVIDPATNELFVVEETDLAGSANWQHVRHEMVAVSLTTRRELWHRDVDPPHGNSASNYYVPAEQQRPGLTLLDGRVYAAFGGLDGDCGQYKGFVVDLADTGRGPLASYAVPSERQGAIWSTGGAFVSAAGDLYVATGNGASRSAAHFDEGDSVIELSPALSRVGIWAPADWLRLNKDDGDLGSTGPIPVAGTPYLFITGKPQGSTSVGYLMGAAHLDGIGRGSYEGSVCKSGGAFGADATAVIDSRSMVYVPCGDGTTALRVASSSLHFSVAWRISNASPSGPPVVAGGAVWALNFHAGELYGMNPSTGAVFVKRSAGGVEGFRTFS